MVNAMHYDDDDYAARFSVYLPHMGLMICGGVSIDSVL